MATMDAQVKAKSCLPVAVVAKLGYLSLKDKQAFPASVASFSSSSADTDVCAHIETSKHRKLA